MTYTFKLARRLAVSQRLSTLPAILVFAACSGDATAPGNAPGPQVPVAVSINPRHVTIETNQLIRFLASGRNSAGDSVYAPITWSTTGGTILPDGRFSSAASGKFMVTGMLKVGSPENDEERFDSSFVEVVRRWPFLSSIQVAPKAVSLDPGARHSFLVTGRLKDGRAVPVGTVWNATGGTIDAGGNYVAGDTAGTYQVIATNPTVSISDTAIVTIIPLPVQPAPPGDPEVPVLAKVTLVPASATLAPGTTRQFKAYGTTIAGDSVPVGVVFVATGGTVTGSGLYTAASTAGTYRIIAKAGTLADTSAVTVTRPLGSGPAGGVPYGAQGLMSRGNNPGPLTFSSDAYTATTIMGHLAEARAKNLKVVMNMTGGDHKNYQTNGVFDMAKWQAKMDTYNTPAIKAAVAAGVADGTILGNSVMDEPGNTSNGAGGGDANSWGPAGTMTKPMLNHMARYVKAMFPTLPVGFLGRYDWQSADRFTDMDFAIRQYSHRLPDGDAGNITRFISEALAQGEKDGIATAFSMNLLNGGIKTSGFNYNDYIGTGTRTAPQHQELWVCSPSTTGGRGQKPGNCRMHPSQVEKWGKQLGSAGVGLMMWRWDSEFMSQPGNQAAFAAVAAHLGALPFSRWLP
jgi:hypothetical protein